MVTFNFIYGSGSQFWSSEARNALQTAANTLSSYIVVSTPVTLTYDVTGNKSLFSSTLATAEAIWSATGPGFFNTVVQQRFSPESIPTARPPTGKSTGISASPGPSGAAWVTTSTTSPPLPSTSWYTRWGSCRTLMHRV